MSRPRLRARARAAHRAALAQIERVPTARERFDALVRHHAEQEGLSLAVAREEVRLRYPNLLAAVEQEAGLSKDQNDTCSEDTAASEEELRYG